MKLKKARGYSVRYLYATGDKLAGVYLAEDYDALRKAMAEVSHEVEDCDCNCSAKIAKVLRLTRPANSADEER